MLKALMGTSPPVKRRIAHGAGRARGLRKRNRLNKALLALRAIRQREDP
jgi:hypothetical protein